MKPDVVVGLKCEAASLRRPAITSLRLALAKAFEDGVLFRVMTVVSGLSTVSDVVSCKQIIEAEG